MTAFKQAITNMHWLTLSGMKADEYKFILESDWSSGYSGYMSFAQRDGKDHLVDIGSRAHGLQSSSYLSELDAVVWACKRTKAFRGSIPLIIRTDSNSLYSKVQSRSFYDADVRVFRRWAWLLAKEPGFWIEFVPETENSGADLLSRPVEKTKPKKVQVFNLHRMPEHWSKADLERETWDEHLLAHWGAFKTYKALRRRGILVTWEIVRDICATCEICAKYRDPMMHLDFGQPSFLLEPGHTVFTDVLGPVVPGRGGVQYIQCIVDSATRVGGSDENEEYK